MEEARTVLARADPVRGHVVVAVPTYVIALVDDEGGHAQLLGAPLGDHAAGQPSAHDEQVNLLRGGGQVAAQDVGRQHQGRVRLLPTLEDRVLTALPNDLVEVAVRRRGPEWEGSLGHGLRARKPSGAWAYSGARSR